MIRWLALICLLLYMCAGYAQDAMPAEAAPPLASSSPTASAKSSQYVLETRDAKGKLTGTRTNPESLQPWKAAATPPSSAPAQQKNLLWESVNTILKLVLVLIISYGLALLFKKFFYNPGTPIKGFLGDRSSGHIRIMESISLGQGRQVHLLSVGHRRFLVGATPQQVTLLEEIGEEDLVGESGNQPPPTLAGESPFRNTLSRFVAAFGGSVSEGMPAKPAQPGRAAPASQPDKGEDAR